MGECGEQVEITEYEIEVGSREQEPGKLWRWSFHNRRIQMMMKMKRSLI